MRRIEAFRFAKNLPASRLTIQRLKHPWPRALSKRDQRRRATMRGDVGLRPNTGGHRMRKSLLAAAAVAAVLLLGASADKAAAMMSATPTQLGLTNPDNSLVQKAALVCNRWGCRQVWAGRQVVGALAGSHGDLGESGGVLAGLRGDLAEFGGDLARSHGDLVRSTPMPVLLRAGRVPAGPFPLGAGRAPPGAGPPGPVQVGAWGGAGAGRGGDGTAFKRSNGGCLI